MSGSIVVLGVAFSTAAGFMAFLITHDEALHRFPRAQAHAAGAHTGLAAFAFFAVVSLALGVIL